MEVLDEPPSVEELSKAIDTLACGEAPGKTAYLGWKEDCSSPLPAPAPSSVLGRGDCTSDCNNYREIPLLSVGKAFAHVVLNRLQSLAELVYPEAKCMRVQS